ncbi:MAG: DinB family protein [Acidobacteria bacterium]|nr:DinB family protein [Acidobacteriota bacterium]
MDFRELFLKQKEATRKRTREVFPHIPRDKAAWAPVPGALPLGLMLRHIGSSEAGTREVPLYNRWNYYERRIPQGLFAILGEVSDIDQEIQTLERIHQETIDLIVGAPAEIFEQEFRNEKFNIHRKGYVILLGIIEHEVHHRAQLLTYLRILGHPMPGY